MKRSAPEKTSRPKNGKQKSIVPEFSKHGDVNSKHRRDFDRLLDDAVLGVKKK